MSDYRPTLLSVHSPGENLSDLHRESGSVVVTARVLGSLLVLFRSHVATQ